MKRYWLLLAAALLVTALSGGLIGLADQDEDEPVIRILGTVALSGTAANIGPGYDRAMRLAVEEINKMGIEGFSRIEYKVIDNETDPAKFRQKLLREIQTWHPDVAGGAALETTIRVLCDFAPRYKLLCFVGGHLSMTKYLPPGEVPLSPWVVYYGYSDFFAGQFAGQFFEEMGCKKVALLAGDYDWGYSNGIGLKYYWETHGQPFEISPVIYVPLDKTDYSTEIQLIKQEKPDAIFIPYTGAGWMSAATQLKDAGAAPRIILYGTTYSNMGGAKVTGAYGAEGIYTLADHDPTTDGWREYVQRWKEAYGAQSYPDTYSNNYYQLIYWIKALFERVYRENPEAARAKDPEVILEYTHKVSYQNVCISPMGPMGPDGENLGAKGAIVQFVPGASDLDPTFPLHPVLVRTFLTPELTSREVLDIVAGYEKLEPGVKYPAAGG